MDAWHFCYAGLMLFTWLPGGETAGNYYRPPSDSDIDDDFYGLDPSISGTYTFVSGIVPWSGHSAWSVINVVVQSDLAPVPEPASMALLGLGIAGLALRHRRQRR